MLDRFRPYIHLHYCHHDLDLWATGSIFRPTWHAFYPKLAGSPRGVNFRLISSNYFLDDSPRNLATLNIPKIEFTYRVLPLSIGMGYGLCRNSSLVLFMFI